MTASALDFACHDTASADLTDAFHLPDDPFASGSPDPEGDDATADAP
ncbi:hypothetical protein [Tautonia rosea]|nr:hypothetical protein [Tautonia rosea]